MLFELSHFYSERDGIGVKVTRYMESIERDVLPYIDGDPEYFYDPTSGKMRPEYEATMHSPAGMDAVLWRTESLVRMPGEATGDGIRAR